MEILELNCDCGDAAGVCSLLTCGNADDQGTVEIMIYPGKISSGTVRSIFLNKYSISNLIQHLEQVLKELENVRS